MARLTFRRLETFSPALWALVASGGIMAALGLGAAVYMESHGHIVTGMSNQIVWGLPHVFAVFLIVSASGALNVASIASVFNKPAYKPYARLSAVLAIALLIGGLTILVLDLGRPDRLIVAMTTNNFKSIFAWNIYLYTGFVIVVATYLFAMMDRRASQSTVFGKTIATIAFLWRLILTTGTGSIFGFLVARAAYHGASMAPLFIAASFLYGLAFMIIVLIATSRETRMELIAGDMIGKLRNLLIVFAFSVLYFTVLHHVTKLYASKDHGVELFLLVTGGIYPALLWVGQIGVGLLVPVAILFLFGNGQTALRALTMASFLFLLGGLVQMYVIIIGGQAYPLTLFPGMDVSSSFYDGQIASYWPSLPELLLGLGGLAFAMLIVAFTLRLMPFLPETQTKTSEEIERWSVSHIPSHAS
jgi:Ni/Fe-hydrogenase subunit HybB-like protein